MSVFRVMNAAVAALVFGALMASPALAEQAEQDDVSKALDSTATQWSYQFAYQSMPNYHDDTVNGEPRPQGSDNFVQARIVAPIKFDSFTLLPRLTLRHYENSNGDSGFGNTELFGLIIPKSWDWGTGRMGLGPLITAPGDEKVAKDEWGYGAAGAWVNTSGNWFYGVLLTQSWRAVDPEALPPSESDTQPLGIAPFLNYQLGNGWFIGNGDMVARYDWDSKKVYLPIGVRVGRVIVRPNSSINIYAEYQTALIYDNYPGPAVEDSIRINFTLTMPAL